ncbi:MAG: AraC family transcriptional regulator [Flavobacteriales bacterium]|nr:AraC family transcriptional regulator [Flavobacteriales bacterium]
MSCVQLIELVFSHEKHIRLQSVIAGEVVLKAPNRISDSYIINIFRRYGFEPVYNPDEIICERIKQAAVELIFYAYNANSLLRNSDYISQKLQLPYDRLSKLFSKVTGTTLEKYIILLKIEKTKEMLLSDAFTVSEIAFMMGYSSVQYLSNQFKKITGETISAFKTNPSPHRIPIDKLLD